MDLQSSCGNGIENLVIIVGLTGSGKSTVVRRLVKDLHGSGTFIKTPGKVIINDGPITGLDPQLQGLKSDCKTLGIQSPFLVQDAGCLCCDGGSEDKLMKLLRSFSPSTEAASGCGGDAASSSDCPAKNSGPIIILELDGATSLSKLPRAQLLRLSKRVFVVAVVSAEHLAAHLSSLNRPLRGTEPCAALVIQQVENSDCVVLLDHGSGSGSSGSGRGISAECAVAAELCEALNPKAHVLYHPSPPSPRPPLGTPAQVPTLVLSLATLLSADMLDGQHQKKNQGGIDDATATKESTAYGNVASKPRRVRRFEFTATRPFHPVKFVEWVVKRLPAEDGSSAFKTLVSFDADNTSGGGGAGGTDDMACVAVGADLKGTLQPLQQQQRQPSAWSQCARVASNDLWLASQPVLRFQLSFTGCHIRLVEHVSKGDTDIDSNIPDDDDNNHDGISAGVVGTSSSNVVSETGLKEIHAPPAVLATTPSPPPPQQPPLHQRVVVVHCCTGVDDDASERSLRACLNACLLTDEELETYQVRHGRTRPPPAAPP